MLLDHLTTHTSHTRGEAGLDLLTASNGIKSQLQLFLISGKIEGLAPATLKYYDYTLNAFLAFCHLQKVVEVGSITRSHIRLFLWQLQEHNNPVSVLAYFKAVRRFTNWLLEEGAIKESPMTLVKPPPQPKLLVPVFTTEQIMGMLDWCDSQRFCGARNRAIVLMFLDTGIRLSEMAVLTLVDFDFYKETVRINGKGAKQRVVRIGTKTQKALLKYLLTRDDKLPSVWLGEERRPLKRAGIQTMVKKLCYRAGVTGVKIGPHTFRHTCALNCLRNGMGEFQLQMMLGHSTLAMTRRYVSMLNQEDVFKAHKKASPVDNMRF